MVNDVIKSNKFADGIIKDEVGIVTKDVFLDVVNQDVDDMVKNVVEDVAEDVVQDEVEQDVDDMVKVVVEDSVKEVGDAVDVEENQHKWEHWPSPASSQEMGLQCTKKDWSFFCTLKTQSIKKGWPFFLDHPSKRSQLLLWKLNNRDD